MKRKPIVKEETPIEKAHRLMRERRESGEVIERKNPIEKALAHPNSKVLAIKAKCWDCCGGQRNEIRDCPCQACPLWPHRPYQKKDEENEEEI